LDGGGVDTGGGVGVGVAGAGVVVVGVAGAGVVGGTVEEVFPTAVFELAVTLLLTVVEGDAGGTAVAGATAMVYDLASQWILRPTDSPKNRSGT